MFKKSDLREVDTFIGDFPNEKLDVKMRELEKANSNFVCHIMELIEFEESVKEQRLTLAQVHVHHLIHAILAKPHTSMYLMHKYWARKPHNVVREYIEHYSSKGDVVLDPFCGSGVSLLEAIKIGRNAIGIDLAPMAVFITKMTGEPIEIDKITRTFDEIKKNCITNINKLYETTCKECNKDSIILAAIWDREKKIPTEIRYYCVNCEKRLAKVPDRNDINNIKHIEKQKINHWYPTTKLSYNGKDFMKKETVGSIPELFTKRNLIALSILFNEIEKIKDPQIKYIFKFAFSSMSHLASKMCPVAKAGGKGHWSNLSTTSFWALQSFWVPPIFMESNVWMLFNNSINGNQGIIKGKADSNNQIKYYKEAKKFEDLRSNSNILLLNKSALNLSDIPHDSVDFVFTDPPYGGSVQYMELTAMWNAWLRGSENDKHFDWRFDEEITINHCQNKDFDYYHKMLHSAFREMYRVLRPSKYMIVTFHNTDIKIYNSIIRAAVIAGFEIEKIVYQPPARPSAKQLLQPHGSAIGDYYIRFRKPFTTRKHISEEEIDKENFARIITESIKKIIAERGESTSYSIIVNSYAEIYQKLKESGYLFSASRD